MGTFPSQGGSTCGRERADTTIRTDGVSDLITIAALDSYYLSRLVVPRMRTSQFTVHSSQLHVQRTPSDTQPAACGQLGSHWVRLGAGKQGSA